MGQRFFSDARAYVRRCALAERDRWALWLPVGIGAGIGMYFALPVEPPVWGAGLALAVAGVLSCGAGRGDSDGRRLLCLVLACLAIGFTVAKVRTEWVRAPVLAHKIGPIGFAAHVVAAEPRGEGYRVVLAPEPIRRLGAHTPARVRLTLRHSDLPPPPGSFVRVTAVLMPPPGPAMPGDADFARWAFFRQIGAVGYGFGTPETIAAPRALSIGEHFDAALQRLRDTMTGRIRAAVLGADGAIAAALITGERANITQADEDAYRDSGLTHVLSISGVHLALAGGIFFWVVRALLALIPGIALRYPIKKWAAVAALLGSSFYLLISGADPPAVRSQIMLASMFAAILFDRPALSMRAVALAAGIVLVLEPESLTDPGAQMSFASVVALIALAEGLAARRAVRRDRGIGPRKGLLMRVASYGAGIVGASLAAGLASAPIAIFHFDRASGYGLISNLLAEPVVGTVIMPAATAAMVAMPFGLEAAPLWLMGKGVAVMSAIARWTASLPGAASLVPVWPLGGFLAVMIGFLWVALWQGRWRWWGMVPIGVGLAVSVMVHGPDLLIAREMGAVAVRLDDGKLYFLAVPKDEFAAESWMRRAGDARDPEGALATSQTGLACDGYGCVVHTHARTVAFDTRVEAVAEDCRTADIVIAAVAARAFCRGPAHLIDKLDVWKNGGVAVRLPWQVETVAERRGVRPWASPLRPATRGTMPGG